VWNFIFLEEVTEALHHLPSISVLHLPNHYVTLVVDGEKYYFHDSLLPKLKVKVLGMVNKIHDALKVWYKDNAATVRQPIVLKTVKTKVIKEESPLQEDS